MAGKGTGGNLADVAVAMDRLLRVFSEFVRPIQQTHSAYPISLSNLLFLISIGEGDARVNDLVKRGRYVGSNASYALKFLQDSGFIDRRQDPDDRRNAVVSWTEKGRALVDALRSACESASIPGNAVLAIRSFENHCVRQPTP
jgi:DNA-binding MarR family transcriptional regulator